MTEHPILFNSEMVKAILEGQKTQTRRVVKPPPVLIEPPAFWSWEYRNRVYLRDTDTLPFTLAERCRYGKVGDTLWVRETHWIDWYPDGVTDASGKPGTVHYRACHPYPGIAKSIDGHWRPSIFMPRWASRITLEIINVRAEQLQDILNSNDTWDEGVKVTSATLALFKFSNLWDSLNKKRGFGWDKNPWVWVIEFKVIEPR